MKDYRFPFFISCIEHRMGLEFVPFFSGNINVYRIAFFLLSVYIDEQAQIIISPTLALGGNQVL